MLHLVKYDIWSIPSKGKHKIASKFEEEVYEAVDQPQEEIPVYKLRSLDAKIEKILHRNHLHPVSSKIMGDRDEIAENNTAQEQVQKTKNDSDKTNVSKESDEESDIVVVTMVS